MSTVEPVATVAPTSGDIAELNGWVHGPLAWHRAGEPMPWVRITEESTTIQTDPPDYLNDPATLGEWNKLIARNGWTYVIDASAPETGIECTLFLDNRGRTAIADEDTELKAKWVAAYRAAEAVRA